VKFPVCHGNNYIEYRLGVWRRVLSYKEGPASFFRAEDQVYQIPIRVTPSSLFPFSCRFSQSSYSGLNPQNFHPHSVYTACLPGLLRGPEDGVSKILRNASKLIPGYTSHQIPEYGILHKSPSFNILCHHRHGISRSRLPLPYHLDAAGLSILSSWRGNLFNLTASTILNCN
jgi:hypothetical protein